MKNIRAYLAILCPLFVVGCLLLAGCKTGPFGRPQPQVPNNVFGDTQPTLAQIQQVVNQNSQKIRSMQSDDARVTVPGVSPVSMRSTLAVDRPQRVRITGGASALTGGQEFDIGSNDEQFWIWFRRQPDKMFFTARLDQWAASPNRQMIPMDPSWLAEALGIVEFRADEHHEGPFQNAQGQYVVNTFRNTPSGRFRKETTIDQRTGAVVLQELFAPTGQPIAAARSTGHTVDPRTNIVYARQVEIRSPGMDPVIISLGNVQFNTIEPASSMAFFSRPHFENFTEINLSDPAFFAPQHPPQQTQPPAQPFVPLDQHHQSHQLYRSADSAHTVIFR